MRTTAEVTRIRQGLIVIVLVVVIASNWLMGDCPSIQPQSVYGVSVWGKVGFEITNSCPWKYYLKCNQENELIYSYTNENKVIESCGITNIELNYSTLICIDR